MWQDCVQYAFVVFFITIADSWWGGENYGLGRFHPLPGKSQGWSSMVSSIKLQSDQNAMEEDPGHAEIDDESGNIYQGSYKGCGRYGRVCAQFFQNQR